jgi:hypothetical protein
MKTKIIAASLAALTMLGGALGLALAETGSAGATTTPTTQSAPAAPSANAGHHGRSFLRNHRKAVRREVVKDSAQTIGISDQDLVAALKSGKSIAEVAQSKGVDPQKVVDALVKDADTRIDKAVADGKISKDRADKVEAKLPAAATKVVNHVFGQHQSNQGG